MLELDWYKCYGESWTGEICPEAFSHPAKFSRALIKRIYEHCIERGWLTEGSVIVDPFGGVALGGFHALQHGMHWLGVELEPAFVRLGSGYDCPGFSQADWTVYQQMDEPDQKNFEIHLCPTCQKTIAGEKVMGLLLEQAPHRFEGNIDLWNRRYGGHFRKWGTARLVQGDSRELREVVGGMMDGICTSPPYAEAPVASYDGSMGKQWQETGQTPRQRGGGKLPSEQYNVDNADNLSNLPTGNIDAVITSSPYLGTVGSDDPDKRGRLYRDPKRRDDVSLTGTYGESEGQLAGMEEGDMILTSPPYADAVNAHGEGPAGIGSKKRRQRILASDPGEQAAQSQRVGYGAQDGQLAAMPAGEADGLVTSPPWESTNLTTDEKFMAQVERDQRAGLRLQPGLGEYGNAPGQIGKESGTTFWSAARIIVSECFEILKPNGIAVFVVKAFVRKKKVVDFPGQWQRLCESVGFETIEFIRAWLIEERGQQYDLFGELHIKTIEFKSFFRRLAERKGSPRIDFEVVLVMRKPQGVQPN